MSVGSARYHTSSLRTLPHLNPPHPTTPHPSAPYHISSLWTSSHRPSSHHSLSFSTVSDKAAVRFSTFVVFACNRYHTMAPRGRPGSYLQFTLWGDQDLTCSSPSRATRVFDESAS